MSERVLMNRAKKRSSIAEKTEERSQLAGEIKDLIKKGDQAANEAERHYRAAGQRLIELKASFPSWTDRTGWENYPRPKSVLASAASELMQIARGDKTLEEVRANTRDRVAKHRLFPS